MATGTIDRREIERAMRRTPLLARTSAKSVERLVATCSVREYQRDSYLFHQDDEATDILFLWRGRIQITSTAATGHRQLHTTLEPPEFFGELGVLGDMRRTATAIAVTDASVCKVPGDEFIRFLGDEREASRAMLRALARQIQMHETLVEDLLFLDLKGRVAKRLIGLVTPRFDDLPRDGATVPSDVTHADLASLSGGSRENVTRILSELQRRGLVGKDGRRYVLRDVAGLRRLAGL